MFQSKEIKICRDQEWVVPHRAGEPLHIGMALEKSLLLLHLSRLYLRRQPSASAGNRELFKAHPGLSLSFAAPGIRYILED